MTDTGSNGHDAVTAARRLFEASVERPERALADLPRILDLLSTGDAPGAPERRRACRTAASAALANLASHDPSRLADATPALTAELRAELDRSRSVGDRDCSPRPTAVREHLVFCLARLVLADAGEFVTPDGLGVVVDALSSDLDDDAVRTAMRALVTVAENDPECLAPAVESLATLLDHPDDVVAALCAGALGHLGEARPGAVAGSADDLGALLERDDEATQHNAVEALAAVARRRCSPGRTAPEAPRPRLCRDSAQRNGGPRGTRGGASGGRPSGYRRRSGAP